MKIKATRGLSAKQSIKSFGKTRLGTYKKHVKNIKASTRGLGRYKGK